MNMPSTAKVPISVWVMATCGLLGVVLFVALLPKELPLKEQHGREQPYPPPFNFAIERLATLADKGLVVVGTSLARHGFPFDTELSSLATQRGMPVHFVRFFRPGEVGLDFGSRQQYRALLPEILKYRPRWVVLQAEAFFLGFVRFEQNDLRSMVCKWSETLRSHLLFPVKAGMAQLLSLLSGIAPHRNSQPAPSMQDDTTLDLDTIEQPELIRNFSYDIIIHSPVFPNYVEEFISRAQQLGITVILLEMNRSKERNEYLGPALRAQLTETLQQVSQRYQIPYWQFRGDLPNTYYCDWAHLNRKGRTVFTDWFLTKLGQEYRRDGF